MALEPLAKLGNFFHVYDFRVKPGTGKEKGDFLGSRFRRIGTVDGIRFDRFPEIASDRSLIGICRVRRAHGGWRAGLGAARQAAAAAARAAAPRLGASIL